MPSPASFLPFTAALACCAVLPARAWPPGFVSQPVGSGWNLPVGMVFVPPVPPESEERLLVWEKGGRIWIVDGGVRHDEPLLDISEEVGNWRDYGMLGVAVDPHFAQNGYIYVLYVVDYHYLAHFGTPSYDPSADEYFHDTIGRLTRYTCNPADGFHSVIPESRTILLGESITTGIPVCHQSHGVGTLLFGEDGTLLLSCGEGASYDGVDAGGHIDGSSNTALEDGIIRPEEDVGAFRSQMINSFSGKVLRLDPATGAGVPSNPFYDPAEPRAPRSRVWVLGLRNPYRMTLRPGTGVADPAAGRPGTLYIGDVGWGTREELNVATAGGQNFGWPLFEGFLPASGYTELDVVNRDAPNPQHEPEGPCPQAYLFFRDLIIQDTLETNPAFPISCDPSVQIPATVPTFIHRRPAIDWSHGFGSSCGGYIGTIAVVFDLGAPAAPVDGPQFGGECSIGGIWCGGQSYPPEFQSMYLHADYVHGWIRQVEFDENDAPQHVHDTFASGLGPIVCLATDPATGDLYYISFGSDGQGSVQHLRYTHSSAPVAVASAAPAYGPTPLTVQFTGTDSFDPEQSSLTYLWDFGDGSPPSTDPNPVHVYHDSEDLTSRGSLVAFVYTLTPAGPLGGGNHDPEVMRDYDFPPVGNDEPRRQFDTYHGAAQTDTDWIGYVYDSPQPLTSVVFQEGMEFSDGGWFDELHVQYRDANGEWQNVADLQSNPPYPGRNQLSFETFTLTFTPVMGTGIRIEGPPGGTQRFVSVGELRAYSSIAGHPTRREATLTVTDDGGISGSAMVPVSLNNTPPVVQITSPLDGTTFQVCSSQPIPLTAQISDAEQGPDDLTCRWQTILHHNTHTHPETPDFNCATTTVISPHGTAGDTFYFEITLSVSDSLGLSTTVSSIVHATCCPGDWNRSGHLDSQDFFDFLQDFFAVNADFNGDGVTNSQDFFAFLTAFFVGC